MRPESMTTVWPVMVWVRHMATTISAQSSLSAGLVADNNSHRYIPELLQVRRLSFSTTMKRLLVSLFDDRFRPRSRIEGKIHHVSKGAI
jgi:hypothetical protein